MSEIKIKCNFDEMVDLDKLTPHPRNPNKHPESQIILFGQILQYTGIRKPVVVSKLSGCITKGHGLFQALQLIDAPQAPVEYQEYDDEAQEFADIVADNELNRLSKTDLSFLNDQLPDLGPMDVSMLGIPGFTPVPEDKGPGNTDEGNGTGKDSFHFNCQPENANIVREALHHAQQKIEDFEGGEPTKGAILVWICQKYLSYQRTKTPKAKK